MNINNNNINFNKIEIKISKIHKTVIFMFFGIIFLIVGLISNISEKEKSKDYIETTGILVDYELVDEDTGYKGIYKYTVDNNDYYISPSRITKKSDYKQTEVVRYDPKNPSEAIIYANWDILIIVGAIIIGITLAILIYFLVKK